MLKMTRFFAAAVLSLWFACAEQASERRDAFQIREVPSPADSASGEPNLYTGAAGGVFLSWLEVHEDGHALRYSQYDGDKNWGAASTIVGGKNWFVNWADFPSLVVTGNLMAAHWLAKSGSGTYAYDVNIALSEDKGRTWSGPIVPHRDNTQTEHGFVSMLPWQSGILAVWLDGRQFAASENGQPTYEMSLRSAVINRGGRLSDERLLDARICDCCPTSAVLIGNRALVVYRDRSQDEIRDISIVRYEGGNWSEAKSVHNDRWQIKGCPVNGPAIAANAEAVAVAWFSAAKDTPRVKVAFSQDSGDSFGAPVFVDDGNPIGRVDVVMTGYQEALASWMEATANGRAEIRVRRVAANGALGPTRTITKSSASRASGFPRMAKFNDEIIFAWTEDGNPAEVRTAIAGIDDL